MFIRTLALAIFVALIANYHAQAEPCRKCVGTERGQYFEFHSSKCGYWEDQGPGDMQLCKRTRDLHEIMDRKDFRHCEAASTHSHLVFLDYSRESILFTDNIPPISGSWQEFVIRDGGPIVCGQTLTSGRSFTALLYGYNRDIMDIFVPDSSNTIVRNVYRIHDGRGQAMVVTDTSVARRFGRNADIIRLYGVKDDGEIVIHSRALFHGVHHRVVNLQGDIGVRYQNESDVRFARFCFREGKWRETLGHQRNYPSDCW